MKQIQIKEQKIDWLKIIKLALDKKHWGKTYTLYNYGDVVINAELENFNFPQDKATFKIKAIYKGSSDYSWRTEETIDYYLKNFTIEDFKMTLQKTIISFLKELLLYDAKRKAEKMYLDDWYMSSQITTEIIEEHGYTDDYNKAEELSEEMQEVVQDDIFEKILDNLNEGYNNKVAAYKHTVITTGIGATSENLYKLYNIIISNAQ